METRVLSRIYRSAKEVGSFGGVERLYKAAKRKLPNITRKEVKRFLESDDAYTLHAPVRWRYPRRKTHVEGPGIQYQIDLLDMQKYKKHNDNNKYILTCIDCFSRYAYAEPLKSKTAEETARGFAEILKTAPRPLVIQSDQGTEFRKLSKFQIPRFSTKSDTKAAIVERFHRTLLARLHRYFTHANTLRWVDVLQDLVASYNGSKHRSIGMAPEDVHNFNADQVYDRLYRDAKLRSARLKVGDKVRISKARRVFAKGYLPGYTREYFTVQKVLRNSTPVAYKLIDQAGSPIDGIFYNEELVKVSVPEKKEYLIERVLRKTKTTAFVKWLGYPESFNSWVPLNRLRRLRPGKKKKKHV